MKNLLLATVAALALSSGVAYAASNDINSLQVQFDDVTASALQVNVQKSWDDDLNIGKLTNSAQAIGNSSDIVGQSGRSADFARASLSVNDLDVDTDHGQLDEINVDDIDVRTSSASFNSTTNVSIAQFSRDDVKATATQINAPKADGDLNLKNPISNSAVAVGNISTIKLK